jgi:hypothetical protein
MFKKDPLLAKNIPRYLYSFTISISLLSMWNFKFLEILPFEKIKILVFLTLIFNFYFLQYVENSFNIICKSTLDSDNKIISSAYKSINILKYTIISFSMSQLI